MRTICFNLHLMIKVYIFFLFRMKLISITKGKGTLWDMELAKTIGKFHYIYNIICLTSIRTKQATEKLMHNIRFVPF